MNNQQLKRQIEAQIVRGIKSGPAKPMTAERWRKLHSNIAKRRKKK